MIKRLSINICTDSNRINKIKENLKTKHNISSNFVIIDNVNGEIIEHHNVIGLEKVFTSKLEDYQKITSKTITIDKYTDKELKVIIYKIDILKLR